MAEKCHIKVIETNIAAESFDDLRYVIYTTRKTTFCVLPPRSSAIKGHLPSLLLYKYLLQYS